MATRHRRQTGHSNADRRRLLTSIAHNQPVTRTIDWRDAGKVFEVSGLTLLPLRLFLGLTFLYAGVQKLTDPGFFRLGAPTYIGTQLHAFSQGSPIAFLMSHLAEHAIIIGALTILTELTVGALVLLGLFTRPAAIVGLGLNLIFFLTASWHTYPYFYGSDIVFVMCWLTLALAGPGAFCLDAALRAPLRQRYDALVQRLLTGPLEENEAGQRSSPMTRAEVVLAGAGTLVVFALGLLPRTVAHVAAPSAAQRRTAAPSATEPSGTQSAAPNGTKVGNVSQVPENSAIGATDPKTGDPVAIIHLAHSQRFVAYDAICTHAGCPVEYDPQYALLVCPCHGGAYDPAHGAQVVAGPPPAPLAQIPLTIDSKGNIYLG